MSLLLLRPGGFVYDFSDYGYYHEVARFAAEGFYPFVDYWMEYPPLWPWVNVVLYKLSLLVPTWDDPRLAHSVLIGLTLLPFDLGSLVLLHRLGKRLWGQARATWIAAVWALLFVPLYTWSGWFDPVPLCLMLLACWFVVERRPVAAGVAVGVGTMVKIVPVLVLATALAVWRRNGAPLRGWATREGVQVVAAFALVVLAVSLPVLLVNPAMLLATVSSLITRIPWETVWALVDGRYGFGVVGANRFDPAAAAMAEPSRVPWPLVHLAFGALGFWLWTRPWDWRRPQAQVGFTGLAVTLFLLWNRGWSPQFLVWLLPWLLLVWPDWRGVVLALALSVLNVAELLFFARWTATPAVLAGIILVRTTLTVVVAVATYQLLPRVVRGLPSDPLPGPPPQRGRETQEGDSLREPVSMREVLPGASSGGAALGDEAGARRPIPRRGVGRA